MGNRLGFHSLFLRINKFETNQFPELKHHILLLNYFCQIHTDCRTLQRNIPAPSQRPHTLYRITKVFKEMDAEKATCHNVQEPNDNLTVRNQETECADQPCQNKEDEVKTLSKKALKRIARAEKHREYKRRKKEETLKMIQKEEAGYSLEDLDQSSYYFENGLRKVYPYTFVFATHAKGRWIGRKLHEVLESEFGYDQPDDLVKAFERGLIHVNSRKASLNHIIKNNDYISHKTHRHENPVTAAPIEIIENSDDVLVINKPSSIPCHPCGRYRFNSVVYILGKELGLINLRHIYRLDRLTSGILILGKTIEKTRTLMDQVVKRQVQKEYVCRVVGKFPDGLIKVDQPLEALSNKLRLQVVSPSGKSSQTTFTRISYNGKSSVVRCIPHTGRTHQIRVHLQYLGHPIINDVFYNSDTWGPGRGKNGVYEIPFDKVCKHFLAEHHETLWLRDGNPLYEEKLREMQARQQQGEGPYHKSKQTCDSCADKLADPIKVGTELLEHSHPVVDVSPTKAINGLSEHNDKQSICSQEGHNHLGLSNSGPSTSSCCGVSTDPPVSSNHPGSSDETAATTPDPESSRSTLGLKNLQPGFDKSKWSVDLTCDLCKKRSVDLEEKHLVMFLHAIKYKGPDWEYKTALPDWAADDWNREDEFILGSTTYHMF